LASAEEVPWEKTIREAQKPVKPEWEKKLEEVKRCSEGSARAEGQPWKTWEALGGNVVPAKVFREIGPDNTITSLEIATSVLREVIKELDSEDIRRIVGVARDLLQIPIEWYGRGGKSSPSRSGSGSPSPEAPEIRRRIPPGVRVVKLEWE